MTSADGMAFDGEQLWLQLSLHERGEALCRTLDAQFEGLRRLDRRGGRVEGSWDGWDGSYVQVEWPDDPATIVTVEALLRDESLVSIKKTVHERWAFGVIDAPRMAERFFALMGSGAITGVLQPPSLVMLQSEMRVRSPFGLPQLHAANPATGRVEPRRPGLLGWWTYWSEAAAAAVGAQALLEAGSLPVDVVEPASEGWLFCLTEAPTDAADPVHRARLAGVLEALPALGHRERGLRLR